MTEIACCLVECACLIQDTNKVLAISRIMVAWQPVGIACGVFDMCKRYVGGLPPVELCLHHPARVALQSKERTCASVVGWECAASSWLEVGQHVIVPTSFRP